MRSLPEGHSLTTTWLTEDGDGRPCRPWICAWEYRDSARGECLAAGGGDASGTWGDPVAALPDEARTLLRRLQGAADASWRKEGGS